jgi:hypothetical protein
MAKAGPGDPVFSRTFWIPDQACPVLDTGSGMTEKGIIQRSYKMMSIVKTCLLRRGEFTLSVLILEGANGKEGIGKRKEKRGKRMSLRVYADFALRLKGLYK